MCENNLGDLMKVTKKMIDHLKAHQKYPATKADLVKECDNLSDFSEEEKRWFSGTLPAGTNRSANDVIRSLG